MKIAISSTGENIESEVSDVFGRCPYFIIAEIKGRKAEKTEAIKNESINQNSGAGVSTAQLMAKNDVTAVISGNIGPRATDILKQFDIEIYAGGGKVKDIIEAFIAGKLKKIE